MLGIHYLVGVSHFTECHESRLVTVRETLTNLPKSYFRSGEGSGTVIRNPYPRRITTKVKFFQLVGPIIRPSLSEIG